MANEPAIAAVAEMGGKIHLIRGQRVMLDSDLALIYGVTTKRLNQQLKRNYDRFPADFAFQLTAGEGAGIRSQIATASDMRSQNVTASKRNTRYRPWAFTEHGAIMLAAVLKSERARDMSVFVVRAFVQMHEVLTSNRQLAAKLDELEKRVGGHDQAIGSLVAAIRQLLEAAGEEKPKREIGFHIREQAPRYRISRKS